MIRNWIFGVNTLFHVFSEIRVKNGVMTKSGEEKDGKSGKTELKSAFACEFSGRIRNFWCKSPLLETS